MDMGFGGSNQYKDPQTLGVYNLSGQGSIEARLIFANSLKKALRKFHRTSLYTRRGSSLGYQDKMHT
jgi:hypothetical protein